ncbi:MAG TPA: hypothetical protein VII64_01860 [Thermodesulfobacteriota bacterium]
MTQGERLPTEKELKEEDRRIRHLRRMVDFTVMLIIGSPGMSVEEASGHVAALKEFAMRLFPGKEHVFDMVYGPRLRRILNDKFRMS